MENKWLCAGWKSKNTCRRSDGTTYKTCEPCPGCSGDKPCGSYPNCKAQHTCYKPDNTTYKSCDLSYYCRKKPYKPWCQVPSWSPVGTTGTLYKVGRKRGEKIAIGQCCTKTYAKCNYSGCKTVAVTSYNVGSCTPEKCPKDKPCGKYPDCKAQHTCYKPDNSTYKSCDLSCKKEPDKEKDKKNRYCQVPNNSPAGTTGTLYRTRRIGGTLRRYTLGQCCTKTYTRCTYIACGAFAVSTSYKAGACKKKRKKGEGDLNIGNLIFGKMPKREKNQSTPKAFKINSTKPGVIMKGVLRVYVKSFDDLKVCDKKGQCVKVCYNDGTNCPHRKK